MAAMTLEDIEKIPKEILLAEDIAPFLGAHPDTLRWQAQHEPDKLGFPVIVYKNRPRFPKAGFLFFFRYGRPIIIREEDAHCAT